MKIVTAALTFIKLIKSIERDIPLEESLNRDYTNIRLENNGEEILGNANISENLNVLLKHYTENNGIGYIKSVNSTLAPWLSIEIKEESLDEFELFSGFNNIEPVESTVMPERSDKEVKLKEESENMECSPELLETEDLLLVQPGIDVMNERENTKNPQMQKYYIYLVNDPAEAEYSNTLIAQYSVVEQNRESLSGVHEPPRKLRRVSNNYSLPENTTEPIADNIEIDVCAIRDQDKSVDINIEKKVTDEYDEVSTSDSSSELSTSSTSNTFLEDSEVNTLSSESQDPFKRDENIEKYLETRLEEIKTNQELSKCSINNPTISQTKGVCIWSVVKKLIECKKTKYIDFYAIHANKDLCKELLVQSDGYYDGFFNDLAEYIEEHVPVLTKKVNSCSYAETVSDIYMRKSIEIKDILKCITNFDRINDYSLFENKLEVILAIPEIYKDLFTMSLSIFKQILIMAKELSEMGCLIIEYLYSKVNKGNNQKESEQFIINQKKSLSKLKKIAKEKKRLERYTAEELYKLAYKSFTEFYNYAPYYYIDKNNGNTCEAMMEKDVIVEDVLIKCRGVLTRIKTTSVNRSKIAYRFTSVPISYVKEENKPYSLCNTPVHFHVQFVDNSAQVIRRVCLPSYKTAETSDAYSIHTISDIVNYLKEIYKIKEIGRIYTLVTKKGSSQWSILSEDKKKKYDILDLKEEKSYVVFYYIKEGLIDDYFTLSVFKRPEKLSKRKTQIPLFLSRFMESAMKLGHYTKEKKNYERVTKEALTNSLVTPCVYTYDKPISCKVKRTILQNQPEKYYSDFYLNTQINKSDEFCTILSPAVSTYRQLKLTWYARPPGKSSKYTHCLFRDRNSSTYVRGKTGHKTTEQLMKSLKNKSFSTDNPFYIFFIPKGARYPWKLFLYERKRKNIHSEYDSFLSDNLNLKIVGFKEINRTKNNLVIHNKILKILLSEKIECKSSTE